LWDNIQEKNIKCKLCARRCIIYPDKTGFCRVRKNINGTLYSLNYGKVCAAHADPIEKKPLFHFHPGTKTYSIATVGCNFRCKFCCNWQISQENRIIGSDYPPEKIVKLAKDHDCQGISYTYTEPTIFLEYAYDIARHAKKEGLYNTIVTNGYMTTDAVEVIAPYLDAATVDFKGGADPGFYLRFSSVPSVAPIFEALKAMKHRNLHIEVTNLVVPEFGDSMEKIRDLCSWIATNLGKETPMHFLRFHPQYDAIDLPITPRDSIAKARQIANDEGLLYVYAGNLPGDMGENTYCPKCQTSIVERWGFSLTSWNMTNDARCPSCGTLLPFIFNVKE